MEAPSSYFFKSPPVQHTDDEARRLTEEYIRKHGLEGWEPADADAVEDREPELVES